jgi:hypothetical protein
MAKFWVQRQCTPLQSAKAPDSRRSRPRDSTLDECWPSRKPRFHPAPAAEARGWRSRRPRIQASRPRPIRRSACCDPARRARPSTWRRRSNWRLTKVCERHAHGARVRGGCALRARTPFMQTHRLFLIGRPASLPFSQALAQTAFGSESCLDRFGQGSSCGSAGVATLRIGQGDGVRAEPVAVDAQGALRLTFGHAAAARGWA